MNVLILDGAPRDGRGAACRKIAEAAANAARAKAWSVTAFELDGMDIKPCRGCFACWLKHPGTCAIQDDEGSILKAWAASELHIWLTPVVFGGYGPALKKALDRSIPNVLPFFTKVRGEAHHPHRYEKRRSLFVLGTLPSPDAEAERVFHDLVARNAINHGSTMTLSRVLYDGTDEAGVDGQVKALFDELKEDQ
jgi:multimeric flavodoxin WrbA